MQDHKKGIQLMIITSVIFAMQDSLTKMLSLNLPVQQFVGLRFLVFLVFALWWTTRSQPLATVLKVKSPVLQLSRGVILGLEILLFGAVIRHLQIAEMQSIFLTFPLIATALSPFILGEFVGWRRWLAISVGFAGSLIVIAPGSVSFTIYSLLGLACAVMFAIYSLLTSIVGRTDSANSSLLYTGIGAAAVSAPFIPFVWQPMSGYVALGVLGVCISGVTSHFLLIRAIRITPMVVLQPFSFLILPWSVMFGYIFFGELIEFHQWLGMGLVLGSGLFVAIRQRHLQGA